MKSKSRFGITEEDAFLVKQSMLLQRFLITVFFEFGMSARRSAELVQCHEITIYRWKKRVKKLNALTDQKRTGRPPIFTEPIGLKTISYYCQMNPLPGCSRWSLRWAAQYLNRNPEMLGISISPSSLHRILQFHSLRPHRTEYFLQITDPDFFPKMEHIIQVYQNPPEYLFCFDESTCLQAKERFAPGLPAQRHSPNLEEFQYVRNGTTDLMAFLRTKTGEVFLRCTSDHKTSTLITVFAEHISQQPQHAEIHYICDNCYPHFNNDFCRLIADLSGVSYRPLKTGNQRRQWLQSTNKRIVFHFVPFHGSWLNQVEIWFSILQAKCIRHGSFCSVPELVEAIMEFGQTWNTYFAHPFKWSYNGRDLYSKAVRRFITMLRIQSPQLNHRNLKKQLSLMSNLAFRDFQRVNRSDWDKLLDALLANDNSEFLTTATANSETTRIQLSNLIQELVLHLEAPEELSICA